MNVRRIYEYTNICIVAIVASYISSVGCRFFFSDIRKKNVCVRSDLRGKWYVYHKNVCVFMFLYYEEIVICYILYVAKNKGLAWLSKPDTSTLRQLRPIYTVTSTSTSTCSAPL